MPLVSVSLDGTQVAAVSTEGLDVLTVNLGGAKVDEEFAHLEFSGGHYPAEGDATHLIWLSEVVVRPGQRVRVRVSEAGPNSHAGETIDELYPGGAGEKEEFDFSVESRAAVLSQLEKRPHVRSSYLLNIEASSGRDCKVRLDPEEHGFGASFLWNSAHPERVSASLHTYTLTQLRQSSEFTYHYREHLIAGTWAEVTVET